LFLPTLEHVEELKQIDEFPAQSMQEIVGNGQPEQKPRADSTKGDGLEAVTFAPNNEGAAIQGDLDQLNLKTSQLATLEKNVHRALKPFDSVPYPQKPAWVSPEDTKLAIDFKSEVERTQNEKQAIVARRRNILPRAPR
jgi:hypothetical protein